MLLDSMDAEVGEVESHQPESTAGGDTTDVDSEQDNDQPSVPSEKDEESTKATGSQKRGPKEHKRTPGTVANPPSVCTHRLPIVDCAVCGGGNICPHGKTSKRRCKECGGADICAHGKFKYRCRACGGLGVCEHGQRREKCRECGGSAICPHGKVRYVCAPCGGKGICAHGKHKSTCKDCGGKAYCSHGRQRKTCVDCGGTEICVHNRVWKSCSDCKVIEQLCPHNRPITAKCGRCDSVQKPSSMCPHGILWDYCGNCGAKPCMHGNIKTECPTCKSASRPKCPHGKFKSSCRECGADLCAHEKVRRRCSACKVRCKHAKEKGSCAVCEAAKPAKSTRGTGKMKRSLQGDEEAKCTHGVRKSRCGVCEVARVYTEDDAQSGGREETQNNEGGKNTTRKATRGRKEATQIDTEETEDEMWPGVGGGGGGKGKPTAEDRPTAVGREVTPTGESRPYPTDPHSCLHLQPKQPPEANRCPVNNKRIQPHSTSTPTHVPATAPPGPPTTQYPHPPVAEGVSVLGNPATKTCMQCGCAQVCPNWPQDHCCSRCGGELLCAHSVPTGHCAVCSVPQTHTAPPRPPILQVPTYEDGKGAAGDKGEEETFPPRMTRSQRKGKWETGVKGTECNAAGNTGDGREGNVAKGRGGRRIAAGQESQREEGESGFRRIGVEQMTGGKKGEGQGNRLRPAKEGVVIGAMGSLSLPKTPGDVTNDGRTGGEGDVNAVSEVVEGVKRKRSRGKGDANEEGDEGKGNKSQGRGKGQEEDGEAEGINRGKRKKTDKVENQNEGEKEIASAKEGTTEVNEGEEGKTKEPQEGTGKRGKKTNEQREGEQEAEGVGITGEAEQGVKEKKPRARKRSKQADTPGEADGDGKGDLPPLPNTASTQGAAKSQAVPMVNGFCPHGRRVPAHCKGCGGKGLCPHGRRKQVCQPCGGSEICEHGRRKRRCKECGGKDICAHAKYRYECKQCGGKGICEHGRVKASCVRCWGNMAPRCPHGRYFSVCKACRPAVLPHEQLPNNAPFPAPVAPPAATEAGQTSTQPPGQTEHTPSEGEVHEGHGQGQAGEWPRCVHGHRHVWQCGHCEAMGLVPCMHGYARVQCAECRRAPAMLDCVHGRAPGLCGECGGAVLCPHGKHQYYCVDCGGKGVCVHGLIRGSCKGCRRPTAPRCRHGNFQRRCAMCRQEILAARGMSGQSGSDSEHPHSGSATPHRAVSIPQPPLPPPLPAYPTSSPHHYGGQAPAHPPMHAAPTQREQVVLDSLLALAHGTDPIMQQNTQAQVWVHMQPQGHFEPPNDRPL